MTQPRRRSLRVSESRGSGGSVLSGLDDSYKNDAEYVPNKVALPSPTPAINDDSSRTNKMKKTKTSSANKTKKKTTSSKSRRSNGGMGVAVPSLVTTGHFFAVICDDEDDEFWLCQVRSDIGIGTRGKDNVDISWLVENSEKTGTYNIDYDDKVRLCSLACPVQLQSIGSKCFVLGQSERRKVQDCLDDLARRLERDPSTGEDISPFLMDAEFNVTEPPVEVSPVRSKKKRKLKPVSSAKPESTMRRRPADSTPTASPVMPMSAPITTPPVPKSHTKKSQHRRTSAGGVAVGAAAADGLSRASNGSGSMANRSSPRAASVSATAAGTGHEAKRREW